MIQGPRHRSTLCRCGCRGRGRCGRGRGCFAGLFRLFRLFRCVRRGFGHEGVGHDGQSVELGQIWCCLRRPEGILPGGAVHVNQKIGAEPPLNHRLILV